MSVATQENMYPDGTSGHQGTTSQAAEFSRRKNIDRVLMFVEARGSWGVTVKDVREGMNLHHGQASSALSNLHRIGALARLTQVRDRCHVYVVNRRSFIQGRDTTAYGAGRKRKSNLRELNRNEVIDAIDAWLDGPDIDIGPLADSILAMQKKAGE